MRSHGLSLILAILFTAACSRSQAPTQWTPSPHDEEAAQQALSDFFRLLNEGRYSEATHLYAGSYDSMRDSNPSLPPTDLAALMRNSCEINGIRCLLLKSITLAEGTAQGFHFDVEFFNPDGSRFIRGPCCGASPADQPPESVFSYQVIRGPQGQFLVTDMPPYVP